MQLSFKEFIEFIKADIKARQQKLGLLGFIKDPITRFHWYLRFLEFTQKRKFLLPFYVLVKCLFLGLSSRLSFSIPINTLGKGVYIPHYGTIVVNSRAFIGDESVINVGVVIGRHPSSKEAVPIIGKKTYLGPGCKLFGKIEIGNDTMVGANSVVTKDFPSNVFIAGSPAKIIKELKNTIL
jgi:serine O-acetyltransferase